MNTSTFLHTARQFLRPQALVPASADLELVARIRESSDAMRRLPDRALAERARQPLAEPIKPQNMLDREAMALAFAALSEAARRVLAVEFYDVQLLAGIALCRGTIAEMQTGEGKTFAASLPAFLHAAAGQKVHVATPNAYLAGRDYELLAPLYRLLGISTGLLKEGVSSDEKRAAYACDITYGTGYEFGFDYLRDQISLLSRSESRLGEQHRQMLRGQLIRDPELLQTRHDCAIIDEIDSVLIDEACMPLVLSQPAAGQSDAQIYVAARKTAESLTAPAHFTVDDTARRVRLTERGIRTIHEQSVRSFDLDRPWSTYVEHALEAERFFRQDVDYIVSNGRILLVDPLTGRIFQDRSLRDGLHQAIEAKENLPINEPCQTTGRISRQRYFSRYTTICGMTGTAQGCEREFWSLYRLGISMTPARLPSQRVLLDARYFVDVQAKWNAVTREAEDLKRAGRPILVGSRTIADGRHLARRFDAAGIPYQLLNGTQDEQEAAIIARAGQRGMVTIATNMAGRGTDIKLGDGVAELGGLHVIGLEHNDSPRIDRQLVGRSARQGDPGSARFVASSQDSLVVRFAPDLASRMRAMAGPDGEIRADLSHEFAAVQRRAEAEHYAQRRGVLAYDDWIDDVLSKLVKEN